MPIVVQKFGGTSVADSGKILAAARKAILAQNEGNQVVMVVSAMGKNTDMLVSLAGEITDSPSDREMDMLLSTGEQVSVSLMAMAIHSLGHEAISMTGAQIGIRTDSTHQKARIQSISTERMRKALDAGNIVIAAGFQGVDEDANITTLGRGGSDTTAVALAAVLGAQSCEIYTDVEGVFTTDPRQVAGARCVEQVSYNEMLELASLGAGVMHSRAIEFAKKFDVPVHVRSSFADIPGTMIVAEPLSSTAVVAGAALAKDEARITVWGVPDKPGAGLKIFEKVAKKKITMDMVIQNQAHDGTANISFTVTNADLRQAVKTVEQLITIDGSDNDGEALGIEKVSYQEELSKVSIVGMGMAKQSGVAEKMFAALAAENINIEAISTSEIKISVLVAQADASKALRAVHQAFELEHAPSDANPIDVTAVTSKPGDKETDAIVAEMTRMEDLIIDDISLDATQASITLSRVPNKPGLSQQLFKLFAEGNLNVDMIIQNVSEGGNAEVAITVPKKQYDKAMELATKTAKEMDIEAPCGNKSAAKLSIFGIGMRSHTDVMQRIFASLANNAINVEMVSTSEVRVNVVVDDHDGQRAIEALKKEFEQEMGE